MRKVSTHEITKTVARLCLRANINLRSDVYKAIAISLKQEKDARARGILQALMSNADCARRLNVAICQDTGVAQVFVRLGQGVSVVGGSLIRAINKGIDEGYKKGNLRNSIIMHPLKRKAKPGFSPGCVHIDIAPGRFITLTVLAKGFGCENKGALKLFNPTASIEEVKNFILDTVKQAGAEACPPFVIGVGIGGTMDKAAFLAKQALLRPINRINIDILLAKLEKDLLKEINQLGIGPSGLGGKTTALGVNILTHPTHIAGLPVAVNISCHALRSASARI